ncbi:MAG: ATP-binding protein [Bacteroidetes bacterium]|nr:ATP-binding protein [Bacteroidota bacterium]
MIVRSCYQPMLQHLQVKQVTVITGMRRVGKSTAVQYLLEQVKHHNTIYMDCERVEVRTLFNRPDYENIVDELKLIGLIFTKPCVIALDEIQLVENLPSFIKYVYDTYKVKFIVTGSSSYYMKNQFSESLAGRKKIFEMYPLGFTDFLHFKKKMPPDSEKYTWQLYNKAWYNNYKKLYEEYVQFGGFPEVVLQQKNSDKEDLLRDIINSYVELDVKLLSDYSVSEELYKLVKLLAARAGNKIDYSKISSVAGINRQKIASYIHLLEYTYLIYLVRPYTRNIDKEISQQPKLYFADTGILNVLTGTQISGGQLFENCIAAQLKPLGELQYYQKKTGQEIDFIFNGKMAIEVKETAIIQDLQVLKQRASSIGIKKEVLISRYVPRNGFEDFVWGGNIF